MYKSIFKPFLDLSIAIIAIICLLPVLIICSFLIKITSTGPIFFKQERVGENGKIFQLYKFRTMLDKKRMVTEEIFKGNAEVTKIGYYLRRFKIDELPQIFNVVNGQMSIVGPRPFLPQNLSQLNDIGKRRLLVKPGLTGLAQVNGNIFLSWGERWNYDSEYVDKMSLLFDMKIIIKTFGIVVNGEERYLKKPVE